MEACVRNDIRFLSGISARQSIWLGGSDNEFMAKDQRQPLGFDDTYLHPALCCSGDINLLVRRAIHLAYMGSDSNLLRQPYMDDEIYA